MENTMETLKQYDSIRKTAERFGVQITIDDSGFLVSSEDGICRIKVGSLSELNIYVLGYIDGTYNEKLPNEG